MNKLGIYVHIPFCVRKCAYCDFLSFEGMADKQGPYIGALNREVDIISEKYNKDFAGEYEVSSIYFGGGTPTSIKEAYICDLLCKLNEAFNVNPDAEITLEANPGTLSHEKMLAYREAGFNRLSLGLQSADNAELDCLSRIHTYEEFKENYYEARNVGFTNINVDIMTALPFQNEHTLSTTLNELFELASRPDHISAYSLIVEPGTVFYEKYGEKDENGRYTGPDGYALPTQEQERKLYYMVRDRLVKEGYRQYEISNFALPSMESVHNSAYWTRQEYLGLGLNASSLINNVRYKNVASLDDFIENPMEIETKDVLDRKSQMEEFMFLGLRRLEGVNAAKFERTFRQHLKEVFGNPIEELISQGLMYEYEGNYALTDAGIDYGNYCFSRFLLD